MQLDPRRILNLPGRVESPAPAREAGSAFTTQLATAARNEANRQLDDLIRDIATLGDRFLATLITGDLAAYKAAVRRFFDTAIRLSTQLSTYFSWDSSSWEQKALTIISHVDQELSRITAMVHEKEQNRLKIAEAIDSIKGLLLAQRL